MAKVTPELKLVEKLLAYWRSQTGLNLRRGASPTGIARFEKKYGVSLPIDMRQYLLQANGFGTPGDQDEDGFSFWGIDRIVSVAEYEGGRLGQDRGIFLFADYLGWSWGYGVQLKPEGEPSVYLIGGASGTPALISNTLEEFLSLYVAKDERLYG